MNPRTVLLVEDSSRDVQLMQRAFIRAQLTSDLRIVRNGEEALAYLHRQGPYAIPAPHPIRTSCCSISICRGWADMTSCAIANRTSA